MNTKGRGRGKGERIGRGEGTRDEILGKEETSTPAALYTFVPQRARDADWVRAETTCAKVSQHHRAQGRAVSGHLLRNFLCQRFGQRRRRGRVAQWTTACKIKSEGSVERRHGNKRKSRRKDARETHTATLI